MNDLERNAIDALARLDDGDIEMAHVEADDILLEYLEKSGAGELAGAFKRTRDRLGFWYA